MNLFSLPEPEMLPAISMWQPYASLVFEADPFRKAHETRSFAYPAKYEGQRVAIQAAASFPSRSRIADIAGAEHDRELDALAVRVFGCNYRRTLPLGAYLGTVGLAGCASTESLRMLVEYADSVAGIWAEGRFAWSFDDPRRLSAPIPAKGKQGWWKVSAEVLNPLPHKVIPHE